MTTDYAFLVMNLLNVSTYRILQNLHYFDEPDSLRSR
jgi:hypothetical protein